VLVVNQSLVPETVAREDISIVYIPANDLAAELGDSGGSNLVAFGALLACRAVVSISRINKIMEDMLTKNPERLEINKRSLNRGYSWTQQNTQAARQA
jgi:2-oxoglutarate ferredoxin oxidoreductase subunit gamma